VVIVVTLEQVSPEYFGSSVNAPLSASPHPLTVIPFKFLTMGSQKVPGMVVLYSKVTT
jgi:hypothetical protein